LPFVDVDFFFFGEAFELLTLGADDATGADVLSVIFDVKF